MNSLSSMWKPPGSAPNGIGSCRLQSVSSTGATQQLWHSLVNPGCDPGPTYIHGITSQMLVGAPSFDAVAPMITRLLAGRIYVAHNAVFD